MRPTLFAREGRVVAAAARLTPPERRTYVASLAGEEAAAFDKAWVEFAHNGQSAPPGDWRTWVVMAGRGFGKTRAGSEWVAGQARANPALRIALVAASFDEARAVMIEGASGLLSVAADDIAAWVPSQHLLRFTSGAEARLYSGAAPQKLRGPEHHIAWCDELAKWPRAVDAWDMLQLGLRLGPRPQVLVTTTPRSCEAMTRILAGPHVLSAGRAYDNPHLPPAFVEAVTGLYAGTRLGRQELEGEMIAGVPGALWSIELLDACRLGRMGKGAGPAPFTRIVIGVDPPAAAGTCGIVACARDAEGIGHVLADHSVSGVSSERWARAVAAAAEAHDADLVVAEGNQGGDMVENVLRAADVPARVKRVHATHGKAVRADPVATLFEAGKVRLHGRFPQLEAELCGLIGGGGYEGPGHSPDRADAMVWALTELMVGVVKKAPGVRML